MRNGGEALVLGTDLSWLIVAHGNAGTKGPRDRGTNPTKTRQTRELEAR